VSWVSTCTYDRGPQEGRHGFFDDGEFAAVVLELLKDARRDLAQFLRLTGGAATSHCSTSCAARRAARRFSVP